MALTSAGLTDIGLGPGITTNFQIQYESTLPNQARIKANANALLTVVENEFTVTTGWFATPAGRFGATHRQIVNVNQPFNSGANNNGYGTSINVDTQNNNTNAADAAERVKMLFMNEWVEILMSLSNGRWNAGDSSGEGLSQYCGILRFPAGHLSYYGAGGWVNTWLNQHPRQDWVNTTEGTDRNSVSFGCALAFVFYLNTQLGFTINQIIAAGASNLASVYRTLTGDNGDPFPFFATLLEHQYPSTATAAVTGAISNDPFPIAMLSFWADKNTFGKSEVQDVIATASGRWPHAFWLVVEGFSANSFSSLNITAPAPTGPFHALPGLTITQRPDIDFENAAASTAPQRIRIPFDIRFTNATLPSFPSGGGVSKELDATLTSAGAPVAGATASMLFELLAGADPYFTNIDPSQNNAFYLSQDLRVFTATPGLTPVPIAGGPRLSDSVGGAYTYVQQLLSWLNSTYNDPSGTDPFINVLPGQGQALQGDSSVTPLTADFSQFPPRALNNYNFAVARVRLRGPAGPSSTAQHTKVFFRLWSTQTVDTDFQPNSTYRSSSDAAGQPGSPQVGSGHTTLPFFASANNGAAADYANGGPNNHDVVISTGDTVWAYYGCFLNLYDPANQIDGQPVQRWLNGTHHCLIAQIAYDDAPLFVGETPQSSDKLAQRNLQVTTSDNPGPPSTHRVPQTFDVRPSLPIPAGTVRAQPDELMIDWGDVPAGTVASIYWPQVAARDVIALAERCYATHTLTAAEENVVHCEVTGGVTYIPVPSTVPDNLAGLFTLDLPPGVVTGQEFTVGVRRISSKQSQPDPVLHSLPAIEQDGGGPARSSTGSAKSRKPLPEWRYVVGTFQVTIPVSSPDVMRPEDENTLAILKWRLQYVPVTDRWYKVLQRLVGYYSDRVDGLGGDAGTVAPSLTGVPLGSAGNDEGREFTGHVCEVLFDCAGDFVGFTVSACGRERTFHSRRRGLVKVVRHALDHDEVVTVLADGAEIRGVVVRS